MGSKDQVTAKHSDSFLHGRSGQSAQLAIPRSSQHFTIWYLHQFSGLQPVQDISPADTT
jgi:hypothetical protein